jgi:hypothetical protein
VQYNALLIRLILLSLPGVLASKVYRKFRGRSSKEVWESILEIVIFSVSSYLVLVLLFPGYMSPPTSSVSKATSQPIASAQPVVVFFDENTPLRWDQIGGACVVALLLTIPAGWAHTYRLVTRGGEIVRATKRLADEDVWELFFSWSSVKWVLVRDHKEKLAYFGYVRFFSDSESERELVLENVSVHDGDTGEKRYDVDKVYCQAQIEMSAISGR